MYTIGIALVQILFSFILYFIVNWIGDKTISMGYITMGVQMKKDETPAFNFLFRVLSPVVYIILIGAILQSVNGEKYIINLYLITVYYWGIRLGYVIVTNKVQLTNWVRQGFYWIISIGLSMWVYHVIEKVEMILPEPKDLLNQFWILVLLFLYGVFNNIKLSDEKTINRKYRYIRSRYTVFSNKYGSLINKYFHNDLYEALTYSIMIYEDYNRPRIIRWIEYIRFFITKKEHSLGIMQVKTTTYINNKDSLLLAMNIIKTNTQKIIAENENSDYIIAYIWASRVVSMYNTGNTYVDEVMFIFKYLLEIEYKNTNDVIEGKVMMNVPIH